jgi:thiamine-phosphate pyrophosphorylase
MANTDMPQIYLITPEQFSFDTFPNVLSRVLDVMDVACLRLDLASKDEKVVARSVDLVREIAHARDIPLVIDTHVQLVESLGLDGVHLPDGGHGLRKLRETMGPDPILGAGCGVSRHVGLSAGEAGADYVSFGPLTASAIGAADVAEDAVFAWWSEMIEVPIVAEGGLTEDIIARLSPITDFFAIGPEIWKTDDPVQALTALTSVLR